MTPRPARGLRRGPGGAGTIDGVRDRIVGPRVLPLGGESSLAVDADAVRQRLGAWLATQPPTERPGIEAVWREALLVCDQVVARARATLGTGDAALWMVDARLPADPQELARAAGLPTRSVRRAVEVLIAAQVLDGMSQVGRERVVRIRPEVLSDAPVLAAVRWEVILGRLGEADTPAARLIVRELARRTTTEARVQGHFVSASQRELAEATGYSKASMRRHLDALVAAGVIASRSRDRTNSWHRLQPVVFDEESVRTDETRPVGATGTASVATRQSGGSELSPAARSPGAAPLPLTSSPRVGTRSGERLAVAAAPAAPAIPSALPNAAAPSGVRPIESALTLEVNGVRVALPPGVDLTLEQDESGAIWYRAGALRLGPVRFG